MADVYSVDWNRNDSAPELARYKNGATWSPADQAAATLELDGVAPWSGMKRVNLSDAGIVTASKGTNACFTDVEVTNMGQAMVEIPMFWYSVDATDVGHGDHIRYYVSSTQPAGTIANLYGAGNITWAVHPAFIRNTVTKDQIYLGAFEAYLNPNTGYLESKVGVQPTTSQSLAQFRTAAEARGTISGVGWGLQDFLTTTALQLLYLIEYATFDAQTAIGPGITNIGGTDMHNEASITGHTGSLYTDLGNASGSVEHINEHTAGEAAPGITTYANSYRGIENIFGNTITLLDGIKIISNAVWIADNTFDSSATPDTPYINASTDWSATTGVTTEFDYHETLYRYAFIPKYSAGTNWGAYTCDSNQQSGTAIIFPGFGGNWKPTHAIYGPGMFCWDNFLNLTPPLLSYYSAGSRLMYMG